MVSLERRKELQRYIARNLLSTPLTEAVDEEEPQAQSHAMRKALMEKVRGLLRQVSFKFVLREELPAGGHTLTARFVLAIKSNLERKIKYKTRHVMETHRKQIKHYMEHGSQTLQ